jgi:hypothetical protein
VPHGTDAADSGGDMGELQVIAPPNKSLKEARSFHDLPLAIFNLSLLYVDDNISMPFDTGYMVNMNVDRIHLATSE